MTKAKGNTFDSFNSIVAFLGESIGVRAVKGVEDIGLPVFEHPFANGEFGKLKTVVGIKPLRVWNPFCLAEYLEYVVLRARSGYIESFHRLRCL